MAEVGDEEAEQHGAPDGGVGRGAQDEGLVEGEEQVQVGQLRQHDGGAGRDGGRPQHWQRGRGGVGQEQVVALAQVGEEGADEGRDGLYVEEEEAVGGRELAGAC